jgi:hypothetical protein
MSSTNFRKKLVPSCSRLMWCAGRPLLTALELTPRRKHRFLGQQKERTMIGRLAGDQKRGAFFGKCIVPRVILCKHIEAHQGVQNHPQATRRSPSFDTQGVERLCSLVEDVEYAITKRSFDHQRRCKSESELHQALGRNLQRGRGQHI